MSILVSLINGFRHTNRLWPVIGFWWALSIIESVMGKGILPQAVLTRFGSFQPAAQLISNVLAFFVGGVLFILLLGGTLGLMKRVVRGEAGPLKEFFVAGLRWFWPLLGCSALLLAISLLVFVTGWRFLYPAFSHLGLLVFGLWALLAMIFTTAIFHVLISLVEENQGIGAAFRSSSRFVWSHLYRTSGLLFLLTLLVVVLGVGLSRALFSLFELLSPKVAEEYLALLQWGLQGLVIGGGSAFFSVFTIATLYVHYHGNRTQTEIAAIP